MSVRHTTDVLIVGCGAAGLATAIHLSPRLNVLLLSKEGFTSGSSNRAQGGIAVVADPADSLASHTEDTLRAGDGLCDPTAVEFTTRRGQLELSWMIEHGMEFDRENDGFHLTKEGGHSHRRVFHVADATGQAIVSHLYDRVKNRANVQFLANRMLVDVVTRPNSSKAPSRAVGAYAYNTETDTVEVVEAKAIVLATGGASKVYLYTSNPDGSTGDGIAIAARRGARIANMEFNQFHPTCLFHPQARSYLISEAVRGEGGHLVLPNGERFMQKFDPRGELASRDIVARAIDFEMKRLGIDCVYLDVTHMSAVKIAKRFPNISEQLREVGLDLKTDRIPVVPAAHYTCGGILVDLQGCTDIQHLYAVGETAYTGLHGANRLASNSLLECLVFARSAAKHILQQDFSCDESAEQIPAWDESRVRDSDEEVVLQHNWLELRRFMWDYVGIVRSDKRLARAANRLRLLREEIHEYYSNHRVNSNLLELRNLIEVADLIIQSAQSRRESRGLHFNQDHPNPDPHSTATVLHPSQNPLDVLDLAHEPRVQHS